MQWRFRFTSPLLPCPPQVRLLLYRLVCPFLRLLTLLTALDFNELLLSLSVKLHIFSNPYIAHSPYP
jgi:hypothetical protein